MRIMEYETIEKTFRPKSGRRYRHFFYYWKWVNVIALLGSVLGYHFGYFTSEHVLTIVGVVMIEHVVLYMLRSNEDNQWDVFNEKLVEHYKKEREKSSQQSATKGMSN